MFQEFPYTNFHQLNLDWIVKIAKDFLDQYTHIQEVIQTGLDDLAESRETGLSELDHARLEGLAELNQKTLDGLADLQEKYDTLNGLLQAWYDTHSADIAGQLADAITAFNTAAEAKSQALLDSWPADYSELVTEYENLKAAITLETLTPTITFSSDGDGKYIGAAGNIGTSENFHYSELIPVKTGAWQFSFDYSGEVVAVRIHGYNAIGNWVKQMGSETGGTGATISFNVEDDVSYLRVSISKTASSLDLTGIVTVKDAIIQLQNTVKDLTTNNSATKQLLANISNIIKFNLIDKFDAVENEYYNNSAGMLVKQYSATAGTYRIKTPIRLLKGKSYKRSYLYNGFSYVCNRDTKEIISSVESLADPYIPSADVDLYITTQSDKLSLAELYEAFTDGVFNTDRKLEKPYMSADAEVTGYSFNNLKLLGEKTLPAQNPNTETVITGVEIDRKKKNVCIIENLSSGNGYIQVFTTYNGADTDNGTILVNANSKNEKLLDRTVRGNAAYSANGIKIKNINGIPCRVMVYEYTDSNYGHPYKGQSNILIVNGNNNRGNAEFATVEDSVRYALNMYTGNDVVDIYIKHGVYNVIPNQTAEPYCAINIGQTNSNLPVINLHGEDKENTIIQCISDSATSGRVIDMGGKEQIVENLTIKNLRGSNPDFTKRPYCIHNDTGPDPETEYTTTIKNCILYSECQSPIGAGLRHNQKQIYEGCTFILAATANDYGTLYIHGPSRANDDPVGVVIDNCTVICERTSGDYYAIDMGSVPGMIPYTEIPVTFRRTIVATNNGSKDVADNFKAAHLLTIDSALNNNAVLNY